MKVVSLNIRKRDNYDSNYPNEIVGIVQIEGETGKMEVRLFPKTVAEIFRMCKNDVERVAGYNAQQAPAACSNTADEIELQVENNELKQIEQKEV